MLFCFSHLRTAWGFLFTWRDPGLASSQKFPAKHVTILRECQAAALFTQFGVLEFSLGSKEYYENSKLFTRAKDQQSLLLERKFTDIPCQPSRSHGAADQWIVSFEDRSAYRRFKNAVRSCAYWRKNARTAFKILILNSGLLVQVEVKKSEQQVQPHSHIFKFGVSPFLLLPIGGLDSVSRGRRQNDLARFEQTDRLA